MSVSVIMWIVATAIVVTYIIFDMLISEEEYPILNGIVSAFVFICSSFLFGCLFTSVLTDAAN